jgi:DNA-binding NtrC family response regulator
MSNSISLSVEDRIFLDAVRRCAFTNPFSDARREADLRAVGLDGGEWDEALARLLGELERRLAALARSGGALERRRLRGADEEVVTSGILFGLFHRHMAGFDDLIRRQAEMGGESCEAPCAHTVFEALLRYGFTREEAEQYVAIFYQLRRAFYFISNSLVGGSPCMKQLRKRLWDNIFTQDIRWYVRGLWNRMEDFSTLLLGETGTGKGAAASALGRSGFIPYVSARRRFAESFTRAFVPINLSQFPEALIESELFGHRKGAFTGAVERHEGVFARCSPHGAIFLDEIGDASEPVQTKLLQVLQQRTFSPVGSHEVLRFEGRVIAATNRDLGARRRAGTFRDDFFYRLCSDQIEVPPLRLRLREAPPELEALARHILERLSGEAGGEALACVLGALDSGVGRGYAWPGNVRELEQAVRCVLLTGAYRGDSGAASGADGWQAALERGDLTAKELTAGYCQRLFLRHGRYEEVARRTGLDWRTVKKYVEADAGDGPAREAPQQVRNRR